MQLDPCSRHVKITGLGGRCRFCQEYFEDNEKKTTWCPGVLHRAELSANRSAGPCRHFNSYRPDGQLEYFSHFMFLSKKYSLSFHAGSEAEIFCRLRPFTFFCFAFLLERINSLHFVTYSKSESVFPNKKKTWNF